MKKLVVCLCLVSLLCVSVSAYSSSSYIAPDGIPMVKVTMDDGSSQYMTQTEFEVWEASQQTSAPAPVTLASESETLYDADLVTEGFALSSDLESNVRAVVPNGPVTTSAVSGSMKSVLQSVFGTYEPVQQNVTVYLEDGTYVEGTQIVEGISGVDWVYVLGVLGFFLILYSFFRLLGVFFR